MRRLVTRFLILSGVVLCVAIALTTHTQAATQPDPALKFDLTVSLEWQPGLKDNLNADLKTAGCAFNTTSSLYVDDLVGALRQTSAYLYAATEGRAALRDVTIYTDGQHWSDADIRILANSSYRPTAYPGGIVNVPQLYANPTPGLAPTFYPGQIYLGRLWDGRGAHCGRWQAAAGYRTIGHEWGHYAFYLWDEYVDRVRRRR